VRQSARVGSYRLSVMSDSEHLWVPGEEFAFSSSQIKKAGDRIRRASARGDSLLDDDLALLDAFRASHYPALREVQERLVRLFHKRGRLDPQTVPITARPLKTQEAIIAKLVREKTRLNHVRDIAGARIVVPDPHIQDSALRVVTNFLPGLKPSVAKDSRERGDEHGYRAVHVIVTTTRPGIGERLAEIQIRTRLQNTWAQTVERLDAVFGSDLKHGDGPVEYKEWLLDASAALGAVDRGETSTIDLPPPPKIRP
jgi:ppGpp synthetase/RelA/SpoT-type nucleotidyltranferase